tara:strand:+ start:116 stop:349 length:234 start_codon:yes stop_codon:yes gene_type:complete
MTEETKDNNVSKGPRFPDITVQLSGTDGNAMMIIGAARRALKRGGADAEDVKLFTDEVTSGDYDNVLQTVMRWMQVD